MRSPGCSRGESVLFPRTFLLVPEQYPDCTRRVHHAQYPVRPGMRYYACTLAILLLLLRIFYSEKKKKKKKRNTFINCLYGING